MKKSKIIIPAAAILALSVGASVTGTVAWFTASRTASFGVKNMAVINTAGDLGVTLAPGTGTTISGTDKVELSYLRDASFDAIDDIAHVATLNNDGTEVTGTREVTKTLSESVEITDGGNKSYKKVYVLNEWTATFKTSSVALNYLYFNPTNTVSKINEALEEGSVYKAVRVAMRNTAVGDEHTVIWAPYTDDGNVYYVDNAGTLAHFQDASIAPDPTTYVTAGESGTSLVGKYTSTPTGNKNLVAKSGDALVSEGISASAAQTNRALLSTKLQGAHDNGSGATVEASNPTITFTLWFEGLDPNCISSTSITEVSTATAKAVKSMTLGFYAVDSTTLA